MAVIFEKNYRSLIVPPANAVDHIPTPGRHSGLRY